MSRVPISGVADEASKVAATKRFANYGGGWCGLVDDRFGLLEAPVVRGFLQRLHPSL
jgi:hypothetical protein